MRARTPAVERDFIDGRLCPLCHRSEGCHLAPGGVDLFCVNWPHDGPQPFAPHQRGDHHRLVGDCPCGKRHEDDLRPIPPPLEPHALGANGHGAAPTSQLARPGLLSSKGIAAAIPDSRPPYKGPGIGNGDLGALEAVRVWEASEPPARAFVVQDLVPDGFVTALYGDGGQGKSFIGLALALHATLGRPFAGRAVRRCGALYLDAELDADEFVRRAYQMARGLGLERPPEGLYYYRLPGPLSTLDVQLQAGAVVKASGAGLVVLDSLTIASYTADPSKAPDTISVMKALEGWGVATVAIDHIAKPTPGANLSDYRQYGNAFKGYLARSTIQLVRGEGGGVVLRQRKTNFGPLAEPINLALTFAPDRITLELIEATDERLAGVDQHMTAVDRVAHALGDYPEGVAPEALAQVLMISAKTVRNHLSALKQQRRAAPVGDGRWTTFPIPGPYIGDRESGTAEDEPQEPALDRRGPWWTEGDR